MRYSLLAMMAIAALPVMGETEGETTEKGVVFEKFNMESTQQPGHIDMENGVLGIADNRGFTLQSRDGRFVFKPYLFMQTRASLHYYDDEGLDKAYNQDNVANSGFAIPYAILGFTGKTFGRLDYNLSINAAATGGNVLQQAWVDYQINPAARFRAASPPFFYSMYSSWPSSASPFSNGATLGTSVGSTAAFSSSISSNFL